MTKFELQKLRDLPIEGVAERLGLRVERHKCLCPFHDDRHPSLTFSVRRNTFRCWACGESGDSISFVMKVLGKDFIDACRWLADEHNVIIDNGKWIMDNYAAQTEPKPFDASRYERFFERPWLSPEARKFLFEERRLDERVVRWCRLTSWRDRKGVAWLQIPYYNREGKLVGVQNRRLSPLPTFCPPSNIVLPNCSAINGQLPKGEGMVSPPLGGDRGGLPRFRFPKGSECGIYNLPILNMLRPGDKLFIAEGCSDCWSLLSAGHKAIAIPSATLLTQKDIELLNELSSSPLGEARRGLSFHMYPDNDAPGERLFLQLKKVLPSLVHHQLPPDCKDFSEYYVQNQKPPSNSPQGGRNKSLND
ncbi:MAG: hypothetical protein J6W52_08565 [Bacteroidaceae bacterium]|nr:hypothetical protein [Bacteroidaceae bacterium]